MRCSTRPWSLWTCASANPRSSNHGQCGPAAGLGLAQHCLPWHLGPRIEPAVQFKCGPLYRSAPAPSDRLPGANNPSAATAERTIGLARADDGDALPATAGAPGRLIGLSGLRSCSYNALARTVSSSVCSGLRAGAGRGLPCGRAR